MFRKILYKLTASCKDPEDSKVAGSHDEGGAESEGDPPTLGRGVLGVGGHA